MKLIISVFVCYVFIAQIEAKLPPIVKVHSGLVQGYNKTISYENREVFIYEGIPFAFPPVENLRFQKPKPVDHWQGVFKAIKYRPACMHSTNLEPDKQIPMTHQTSEDCLYLSVYRPSTDSDEKRAVMVWIYGGGFETGSAFSLASDASYLASIGDVIVVAMNYRVGAFGFMFTDDELSPGNQGIYDQLEALKWVQQNIEQFGGDPNLVTLFGQSAGSMSTGIHMLSPLSKGLFKRAIMQSGAPNSYIGSEAPETAMEKTKSFAERLDCPTGSTKKMIECLKGKSAKELVEANEGNRNSIQIMEPVYNTEFLPKDPRELLKTGDYATDVDLIFGLVNNEGTIFTEMIFPQYLSPFIEHPKLTKTQAKSLIELIFMILKVPNATDVSEFYLKNIDESDIDGLRLAVGDSFGDYNLACPTVFFGEYVARHSLSNNVYSYRITHPAAIPVFKDCVGYMGVCHGDDIPYLFGFPVRLRGIKYTEDDYNLSLDIMHSWSHFARYGNPGKFGSIRWDPVVKKGHSKDPIDVMKMDIPHSYQIIHGFYVDVCDKFWKPILFPSMD